MTKPQCIGIDGCPGGWVAASTERIVVEAGLAELLAAFAVVPGRDVVAIDIPIGLAESGRRECDVLARQRLGAPRRNSVFWTATRAAIHSPSGGLGLREAQARASTVNTEHGAGGVSAQAFNLFNKIREVDAVLGEDRALRQSIVEVHPELAFACWNAGSTGGLQPMPYAKKSGLGAHDRLELIFARYGRAAFERARQCHAPTRLADDDIADAYACLFSAERIAADSHVCLPDVPETDALGLPMRICF